MVGMQAAGADVAAGRDAVVGDEVDLVADHQRRRIVRDVVVGSPGDVRIGDVAGAVGPDRQELRGAVVAGADEDEAV